MTRYLPAVAWIFSAGPAVGLVPTARMATLTAVVAKDGLTGGVAPLASGIWTNDGVTDSDGSTGGGVAAFAPGLEQCPRQLQNGAPASPDPPSAAQSLS